MNKRKIFVRKVLSCDGDLDVAVIEMNGGEFQICLPKYCNIVKYIGREVYYEVQNGEYHMTEVRPHNVETETSAQENATGED